MPRPRPARAAALLVVVALVAACSDGGDDPAEPGAVASAVDGATEEPGGTTDATTAATAAPGEGGTDGTDAPDREPPTEAVLPLSSWVRLDLDLPEQLFVDSFTPDGGSLYVTAPDGGGAGCEGSTPFSMQTYELATGELLRAHDQPDRGYDVPQPRADGTMLLRASCEGFIGSAVVAEVAADGGLVLGEELVLPTSDDGFADLVGLAPVPGSDTFVGVQLTSGAARVLEFRLDGSVVRERDVDVEVYELTVLADGSAWGVDYTGPDGTAVVELWTGLRLPGYEWAVAGDDGATLVVAGAAGVGLVRGTSVESWVEDDPLAGPGWSAPTQLDGDRWLVVHDPFGTARLVVVDPQGEVETVDTDVDGYGLAVAPDGREVVYARRVAEDDFRARWVHLVRDA